jgi:hypothetical protein
MDLMHSTLPGAVGDLHYGIGAFTGWDRICAALLPASSMRRRAGRKILRAFVGAAPEKRITFTMPADPRVWEVLRDGAITPWRGGG